MAATDPLLRIRVASPCPMSWEDMPGTDRTRYCSKCELTVYNLSGMTADEALALVRAREGRLCVRLYRRADGTVLTKDCPSAFRAARRRMLALAASGAAALATVTTWATLAAPGLRRKEPFASWFRWIGRSPREEDLDGFLGVLGEVDEADEAVDEKAEEDEATEESAEG